MTCPNCGQSVSATAKFCRHCAAPISPPVRPARRGHRWITVLLAVLTLILSCVFCVMVILVAQKTFQGRASVSPTVESGSAPAEPVVTEPNSAAITPPESSSGIIGQYEIVIDPAAAVRDHPDGTLDNSPSPCVGGCWNIQGIVEARQIRILNDGTFVLDLKVNVSQIVGAPSLFYESVSSIIDLEINGQHFQPAESSFPFQITEIGTLNGYLQFGGEIPISTDGQYHVILTAKGIQPIEGWLIQ